MANIRIIKKRINSAKNISQITHAMQMVAASRMRKAQEAAILGRPYQEKILAAVFELSQRVDWRLHPLLREEKRKENAKGAKDKNLVILISTNKGLCGGLNSNLFRQVNLWFPASEKTDYITLGKKGEGFVLRTKRNLLADFSSGDFLEKVPAVTQLFGQEFIKGEYRRVYLVFNNFISSLKQEPVKRRILPLGTRELEEISPKSSFDKEESVLWGEFLIEPSVSSVLDSLLPHYLEIQLRNAILEAAASEHSARMLAMKNATDNANSLIEGLTLEYNRARQESITYEIADMVTARLAVE